MQIIKSQNLFTLKQMILSNLYNKDTVQEVDYMKGTPVELNCDGYQLTIGANLTKDCSPVFLNYCIKLSFTIFMMQMLFGFLYLFEYKKFDQFQPIDGSLMAVRIVFSLLLHVQIGQEIS